MSCANVPRVDVRHSQAAGSVFEAHIDYALCIGNRVETDVISFCNLAEVRGHEVGDFSINLHVHDLNTTPYKAHTTVHNPVQTTEREKKNTTTEMAPVSHSSTPEDQCKAT